MKTLLQILAIVVLLGIEGYAAYAVLHPHVTPEYRAYFIDRTTHDWVPLHYAATPESGIQFGKAGWPTFVRSTSGFSSQEDWGRWTDGRLDPSPKIVMDRQFSGPLCIQLVAHPSVAERGKKVQIIMDGSSSEITLADPNLTEYDVSFPHVQPANTLEFRFAERVPSNAEIMHGSSDPRALGMAVSSLRILPHVCTVAR